MSNVRQHEVAVRMPAAYLALATERANEACWPHFQPEAFKYEFRSWVSPYTKAPTRWVASRLSCKTGQAKKACAHATQTFKLTVRVC